MSHKILHGGAICGLSYDEGFVWDRELVRYMPPEEIQELAAVHRQQVVDFSRDDAEHGTPWEESRKAEILAQIDLFEKLES